MTNGEEEPIEGSPLSIQDVLDFNLRFLVWAAQHRAGRPTWGFSSVNLLTREGKMYHMIESDCDPQNRAMLDKLYELSHVDRDAVRSQEYSLGGPTIRATLYPTAHGLYFEETLTQEGDSEVFRVTYSSDIPYPFDQPQADT